MVGTDDSSRFEALLCVLALRGWNGYQSLQELLGHQWLATTSRYIHVRSEHVELAWKSATDQVDSCAV